MTRCVCDPHNIQRFLDATCTNWRAAAYLECPQSCKYEKEPCKRDFLFIPGKDGAPLLLTVTDAELVFGRLLDKSECITLMSTLVFEHLFFPWLTPRFPFTGGHCPLFQAATVPCQNDIW